MDAYSLPSALVACDPECRLQGDLLLTVGRELYRTTGIYGQWRDFATTRGMEPADATAAWESFAKDPDSTPDVIEEWARANGWTAPEPMPLYQPMGAWDDLVARERIDYLGEHIAHPPTATTGVPRLDEAIGGGMVAGTYTVVGGEGGAGKTALAMVAAHAIASEGRYKALVFSAEITKKEAYDRILAVHTRSNPADFAVDQVTWWSSATNPADVRLTTEGTMRLWNASAEERERAKVEYIKGTGADDPTVRAWMHLQTALGGSIVVIDEGVTCDRICTVVRALWQERVPIVPIIDHIHAIAPPSGTKADREYEAVTATSHALRNLAKECRCPMLVLSELRNLSEKEREEPRISWFRGSGHVGYDAGTAVILMRGEDRADGREVKAHIIKNRRGQSGAVIPLTFNGKAQTIR